MNVWNLNPAIVSLGPLEIRWYGLVYALGFLLAWWILRQAARAGRIPNLTEKAAEDYVLLLIIGSIIGARLLYVIVYNPAYYLSNILEIPAVWHGGLSIHGGLLGAALVTWHWCKKRHVNFYSIADTLVAPLSLVLVFGRLANYANGELWGLPSNARWCVVFPHVDDACRHPSQIYEALYSYALFLILFALSETKRLATGVLFWTFITLYGAFRFLVTFTRALDPTDPGILWLSLGQWLSLAMVVAGLWWFWQLKRTGHPILSGER